MNTYSNSIRPPVPPLVPLTFEPGHTYLDAKPEFLRNCLYTCIFIWTANGRSYWMYPTGFDQIMFFGYIWNRPGWVYTQFEWQQIIYFY